MRILPIAHTVKKRTTTHKYKYLGIHASLCICVRILCSLFFFFSTALLYFSIVFSIFFLDFLSWQHKHSNAHYILLLSCVHAYVCIVFVYLHIHASNKVRSNFLLLSSHLLFIPSKTTQLLPVSNEESHIKEIFSWFGDLFWFP